MHHLLIPKLDTHWTGFQTNAALSIPSAAHLHHPMHPWKRGQEQRENINTALPPSQARRQQASHGRLPTALTALAA